jgi:hypothetical protein
MSSTSTHSVFLTRSWRSSGKLTSQAVFALGWNVISWGLLLALDGGKVFVNDVRYDSFASALAAYPFLSCIFAFPLIGMVMLYHTLALWLNHTDLSLDEKTFVMKSGPISWGAGPVVVPWSEIKKVYAREHQLIIERSHQGDLVIETKAFHPDEVKLFEQWFEEHTSQPEDEELKKAA